ncbi:MAG: polysaccharide biosynthesis protein [Lachnospiraceae bacterium]|nr:polysaccharide biosynthesis protein [Lachnospiraceae bacterium]
MDSLKKNFAYQLLYQLLVISLPLITTPYVARVLGAEKSGIYSYTNTVAYYFVIFGMLGIEQYGNRCIAQVRDDYDKLRIVFTELSVVHFITSIIAVLGYVFYCLLLNSEYRIYFLIQGLQVFSVIFDVNWFFWGIGKFRVTTIRSTVVKIVSVIAIFIFVRNEDDLINYVIILAGSILITRFLIFISLRGYVRYTKVDFRSLTRHFKPVIIMFIAVIAANLNRMVDKVMLGAFGKIEDLGYYEYADRIIHVPLSVIAAIGTVMISKMSNSYLTNKDDEIEGLLDASACLVLYFSFGMAVGLAAISPEFITLFLGSDYQKCILIIIILSISIPMVGWNNYIRTQILIPREMDLVYSRAVICGAVCNIITNTFLITKFGAFGASIATIISYLVILFMQIIPLFQYFHIKDYLKYALFPLAISAVTFAFIRLLARLNDNAELGLLLRIIIEMFAVVIVYGGLSYIYLRKKKPSLLNALIRKQRK